MRTRRAPRRALPRLRERRSRGRPLAVRLAARARRRRDRAAGTRRVPSELARVGEARRPRHGRRVQRLRVRVRPLDVARVRLGCVLSHTGPHTTASAWCTPILKDFPSRARFSPPAPRSQSRHTSMPFNSSN
eukprot:31474-Pelagococcus_subviridis.AAC.4